MTPFLCGIAVGAAVTWLVSRCRLNRFAWMLGRPARARRYQCCDWVDGTVICVTWKGGVRFRSSDGSDGFWIDKDRTGMNLRVRGDWRDRWSDGV